MNFTKSAKSIDLQQMIDDDGDDANLDIVYFSYEKLIVWGKPHFLQLCMIILHLYQLRVVSLSRDKFNLRNRTVGETIVFIRNTMNSLSSQLAAFMAGCIVASGGSNIQFIVTPNFQSICFVWLGGG